MSKHTPGPWHVGTGSLARIVYAANGWAIADAKVYHGGQKSGEDFENARVMAAAPELLAALRRLSFAAMVRDNVMGDPAALLSAQAELRAANKQAMEVIAKAEVA